ncbi:MAG TPA: hypothetical protein VFR67_11790 [Pilimelia sp.]|nr:hypothetical protein [Pilimelia sp.]
MAGGQPYPATLSWAVRLLAAEAVGLGLIAAFLAYEDLTGAATDLTAALALTGFTVLMAAALAGLALALHRRRPAARAPAIVLQLILLPIGLYMIQGGQAWLGIPVMALGLLVTGLIVSRASTRAFGLE